MSNTPATPPTPDASGGPAFPRIGEGFGNPHYDAPGMSLRDYFAAHAPEQLGDNAEPRWVTERTGIAEPKSPVNSPEWGRFWAEAEVILRYQYADAMLRARTAAASGEAKP